MRLRDCILTILLWLLFLYLIRETFTLIYFSFDWLVFGVYHPELHAFKALLMTLIFYGVAVLAFSGAFIGWALYNQVRFRGNERRKPIPAIMAADIAALYKFPTQDVRNWQQARVMTIRHDGQGRMIGVVITR